MSEATLAELRRDTDRLWSEHKLHKMETIRFEKAINDVSKELHNMKEKELEKAVERQKMQNTLENIEKSIVEVKDEQRAQREDFNTHVKDEMIVYGKLKKVISVLGIILIAVIIDNEAGTHIVSSLWSWGVKMVVGI